jgi:hypothetical protein
MRPTAVTILPKLPSRAALPSTIERNRPREHSEPRDDHVEAKRNLRETEQIALQEKRRARRERTTSDRL